MAFQRSEHDLISPWLDTNCYSKHAHVHSHWCVSVTHRIGGSRNQMQTFAPAPVWNRRTASKFFFGCICVVTRIVLPTLAIRVYCLPPLDQMWPASVWLFDKSGFISSNGSVLHNYLFSCKECLVTPILSISRWRTGITNASVPLTSLLLHVLGHSSFSSQTEEARATIGWFSCWHVSHIRIKEFMLNGIAPRLRWLCLQKKNPNR
jgi:hypothetical protein